MVWAFNVFNNLPNLFPKRLTQFHTAGDSMKCPFVLLLPSRIQSCFWGTDGTIVCPTWSRHEAICRVSSVLTILDLPAEWSSRVCSFFLVSEIMWTSNFFYLGPIVEQSHFNDSFLSSSQAIRTLTPLLFLWVHKMILSSFFLQSPLCIVVWHHCPKLKRTFHLVEYQHVFIPTVNRGDIPS